MKLLAGDTLAIGTAVRVGSTRGTVTAVDYARDQFGLPMTVHTVTLTERAHVGIGNRTIWKPCNPVTKRVNYSFITVL